MTAIANRLGKNLEKLKPWAAKFDIEAFRLYDRDIPEYPSIIEVFGNYAVLWDRRDDEIDSGKEKNFEATLAALVALGFQRENIVIKRRERQQPRGEGTANQYRRLSRGSPELTVREGSYKFLVNLHDYLDTGLFLDHRLTRKLVSDHISKRTASKLRTRMLNLFCYTGSFSVYGARAGATVTSVDMNPRYLEWAERNFIANNLMTSNHRFFNEDVLAWMKEGGAQKTGPYEVIVCDPPTFSNSKKMEGTWEIQRDHRWLIDQCMNALTPDGLLIFSANRRDFAIDTALTSENDTYKVQEITRDTLPKDFHDAKIRRVYRITRRPIP